MKPFKVTSYGGRDSGVITHTMMHKLAASLEEEHPGVRPLKEDWLRTAKDILVAHGWFNQFQREHGQKELSLEAFREDPRYGYYLTEVRI